jgi:hypothetical protein
MGGTRTIAFSFTHIRLLFLHLFHRQRMGNFPIKYSQCQRNPLYQE